MANTGQALMVLFTIQQQLQEVQVKVTLQVSTIITTSTCQMEASLKTMEYKVNTGATSVSIWVDGWEWE